MILVLFPGINATLFFSQVTEGRGRPDAPHCSCAKEPTMKLVALVEMDSMTTGLAANEIGERKSVIDINI